MPRVYRVKDKHDVGGFGSPIALSASDAQNLLNSSTCFENDSRHWVALKDKKFYVFWKRSNEDSFYGYQIKGNEACAKYPKACNLIAKSLKIEFNKLQHY